MAHIDLLKTLHRSTKRDYLARVLAGNKAEFAALAKKFDVEYWDGDRNTGYGGYRYDGRWRPIAEHMVDHYVIRPGQSMLDVGCGKGYLLCGITGYPQEQLEFLVPRREKCLKYLIRHLRKAE